MEETPCSEKLGSSVSNNEISKGSSTSSESITESNSKINSESSDKVLASLEQTLSKYKAQATLFRNKINEIKGSSSSSINETDLSHLSEDDARKLFIKENSTSVEEVDLMYSIYKKKNGLKIYYFVGNALNLILDLILKNVHLISDDSRFKLNASFADETAKITKEFEENSNKLDQKFDNKLASSAHRADSLNVDFAFYNKHTSLVNKYFEIFVSDLQKTI